MGQRVSAEVKDRIEEMVEAGSTVSSLSYYVK